MKAKQSDLQLGLRDVQTLQIFKIKYITIMLQQMSYFIELFIHFILFHMCDGITVAENPQQK